MHVARRNACVGPPRLSARHNAANLLRSHRPKQRTSGGGAVHAGRGSVVPLPLAYLPAPSLFRPARSRETSLLVFARSCPLVMQKASEGVRASVSGGRPWRGTRNAAVVRACSSAGHGLRRPRHTEAPPACRMRVTNTPKATIDCGPAPRFGRGDAPCQGRMHTR